MVKGVVKEMGETYSILAFMLGSWLVVDMVVIALYIGVVMRWSEWALLGSGLVSAFSFDTLLLRLFMSI